MNPVFVLPGALRERAAAVLDDFVSSNLLGTGQFCTNPGLLVLPAGAAGEDFVAAAKARYEAVPVGTMLGMGGETSFAAGVRAMQLGGAKLVCGSTFGGGAGFSHANTLLLTTGSAFLRKPALFQTEIFGPGAMVVLAESDAQYAAIAEILEGNLTGTIFAHTGGADTALMGNLEPALRRKVGRLIHDKMPTGVAVSPAMNHGGPYPATGHALFSAVGIPGSIRRFAKLDCYDAAPQSQLPPLLRDAGDGSGAQLLVDGTWRRGALGLVRSAWSRL